MSTNYLTMTPSNGNIFHGTGPLWGESTGHRWLLLTKASDVELWCFLWAVPEQTVEQSRRPWFEMPSHSLWHHCNAACTVKSPVFTHAQELHRAPSNNIHVLPGGGIKLKPLSVQWQLICTGIILCMHPANERWRYIVTSSPIGWVHTQNDPCMHLLVFKASCRKLYKMLILPGCVDWKQQII